MKENQKFIAYFRVSTEKQGKSGLGLDAQQQSVANFVSNENQILESYTEVESGKQQNRPELQKALVKTKSLGATLLIAKLDRLARNVAFIANLLESGVEVVAVDMPQANKFMLHVMAAVAEQEATAISERTRAALQVAKARGVKLGWANPRRKEEQRKSSQKGCRRGKLNADIFALKIYPIYVKLHAQGFCEAKGMADALNERGVRSARGGIWYTSSVQNLEARLFDLFDSGRGASILNQLNENSRCKPQPTNPI